jgi:hypothetical protein
MVKEKNSGRKELRGRIFICHQFLKKNNVSNGLKPFPTTMGEDMVLDLYSLRD